MAPLRLQSRRISLMMVLLIIWWAHMVQGQSPSRCQPRLNYSRSTHYAVEGGILSFQCSATYCGENSSKPRLYWCRQTSNGCTMLLDLDEFANRTKTILYSGSGTLTSLLQISPVLIKHSGKYQCRAQFSTFSQITAMGHLITVLVIKIKVFTPVTKVSGHGGGSLKLQCIVQFDAHLNATLGVRWTKDNEKCNETLSRNQSNDETIASDRRQFTLTLPNLQPDDAGLYYCCITSHLSSQIFGMGSIRVHVNEIKVFTPVTKVSGHGGGSLKLQCIVQFDAHLNATLGVRWTKDNEKCNEPLSRNQSNDETIASDRWQFTLTLPNLQPDDAGLYYCCITSHLSSQIFGMGSIRVYVNAFKPDMINFASLIICKGILLVIMITFGLIWVCLLERRQQKSEDVTVMSERKEVTRSSII